MSAFTFTKETEDPKLPLEVSYGGEGEEGGSKCGTGSAATRVSIKRPGSLIRDLLRFWIYLGGWPKYIKEKLHSVLLWTKESIVCHTSITKDIV
jgi:hypothetical protein